ncbi:TetR/AcrR family transcriptional regulator [Catenulispora rubra]|uniref:TetR/AcrR family transcriptional regulator n=1 Tax=Catenulispora rubra TaxID=280293 RepID=UPI0018922028|nr:TetR/AcrR family transcriptional regulator [Catenulispora rubra]
MADLRDTTSNGAGNSNGAGTGTGTPTRRRRADARQNIDAILTAARVVLGRQPDAGMEEIAATAGVTRQTVYAHFPSRDALLATVVQTAAAEYAALLDDADLDTAPPAEALARFLAAGWEFMHRYPLLLTAAASSVPRPTSDDPHDVVPPRLERIIERGQEGGEFDAALPATWLAAAVLGLHHTAAAQVAGGQLSAEEAQSLCLESTLRVCGAAAAGSS